ncbi:hypothetical protein [Lysobacter gummosus]
MQIDARIFCAANCATPARTAHSRSATQLCGISRSLNVIEVTRVA